MKNLVGLGVDEAVKILNDFGVDFKLTFYRSDKLKKHDAQLVISARDGNPVELIVAEFKFKVD